ncbi:tol-Pal system protein TolA-like [Salvelinus alpinus]|uniref:tol-Pal system protein TolA-like n=1 Tax=Salvelinus alpinus TaxID=8036 RepID=UPI0039FC12A5
MRVVLVLGGLTILVSMGLALIVFGQHLTEAKLTLQNLHLDQMQRARVNQLKERQWLENLLKGQLDWKKKNVEEMGAEVNKLTEEEGKKKPEVEACQADKKQKEEELAPIQKEQSDIEATFKTEKEAWTGEITTLKQQLEQSSKVCGFVKDSDTVKLCPPKEGAEKSEAAPVKAEAAPVKAEAAPVKAEVAPVKAEVAPVKAEAVPVKAEAVPV